MLLCRTKQNQQPKIHRLYSSSSSSSQYTKQEEVKRGYGADVTLRDIKRRSILSSRRNTPPKKSTAGVKIFFYSFVYSLFTHRFCWFILFRFEFVCFLLCVCVISCYIFLSSSFGVQHIFFRSHQIRYGGTSVTSWIKWNRNAVRVLIKPI